MEFPNEFLKEFLIFPGKLQGISERKLGKILGRTPREICEEIQGGTFGTPSEDPEVIPGGILERMPRRISERFPEKKPRAGEILERISG